MSNNIRKYAPVDQVRICTANNTCIEARGDNGKLITYAAVALILAVAAYYISKLN